MLGAPGLGRWAALKTAMIKPSLTVVSLLNVLVAGSVSPQAPATHVVAGCYDLQLGPWLPAGAPTHGDSLGLAPPPRVQLDTVASSEGREGSNSLVLRPAPGSLPSIHRFAYWSLLGADSVVLSWSTGFYGLNARLAVGSDVLRGNAASHSDLIGEPGQSAEMTATRVSCRAPPRFPATDDRPTPRGILLASGDSVRLDMPTPELLPGDSVAGRVVRIRRPLEQIWSPAREVEIWTDAASLVERIEVRLPPDFDFERAANVIQERFGPPVRSGRGMLRDVENQSAIWENRSYTFMLIRSRKLGDPWYVSAIIVRQRS
jgi:hypothetical protein